MKNGIIPDPNVIHPKKGYDKEIYVKPTVKNPSIIVGDLSKSQTPVLKATLRTIMSGTAISPLKK